MKQLMFKNIYEVIGGILKDYRLLFSLAYQDFQKKFAGSFFGIAWAFIQPILTILIYWIVFQYAFKSQDVGDVPFILWFMAGIIPWLFISEAIQITANVYLEYSYLVKKVIFNIDILPLVKIISSLMIHVFFVMFLFLMCILFGKIPNIYFLQFPYYLLCLVVFVYAIGLLTSSIMIFFRDLGQIISIILLAGMWATPIAWNIAIFPRNIQNILKLNPFFYLVEGYRDSFVMERWFWEKPWLTLYFWGLTLIILACGLYVYRRLKPYFSDTL